MNDTSPTADAAVEATAADAERLGLEIITIEARGLTFGALTVPEVAADAPLALCLHGYPDTAFTWRHLLGHLAALGYRPVAPFHRGYAPTAAPADGVMQSGALALDANAQHEALGGDGRAVVIGHDWGAMAAYGAVALEPNRWSRLVAAAVPPGPVVADGMFSYDQLRRSWYMWLNLTDLADFVVPADDFAFIDRLWRDWSPMTDPTEDVVRFARAMERGARIGLALGTYRQTLNPGLADPSISAAQDATMQTPSIPTLYLHGELDGCMGADVAAQAGDHLHAPGSQAITLPGAGHFLQLDRPAEFNGAVLTWLGPAQTR